MAEVKESNEGRIRDQIGAVRDNLESIYNAVTELVNKIEPVRITEVLREAGTGAVVDKSKVQSKIEDALDECIDSERSTLRLIREAIDTLRL